MEKAINREEKKIFSESKKGVNYSIFFIFGMLWFFATIAVLAMAILIALLLLIVENFFGPLQITILRPVISRLTNHQWLIGGLSMMIFIYYPCIYLYFRKKEAHREKLSDAGKKDDLEE